MPERIWRPTRDGMEDTYLLSVAGVDLARTRHGKTLVITYFHGEEITVRAFQDLSGTLRADLSDRIRETEKLSAEQKEAVITALHLTTAISAN